jgi:hypothetical protein
LNSLLILSTIISRCNSHIQAIIVSLVSSFILTLKLGSSSANFCKATHIFSWSALLFGSTEMFITGSGNSIDSTRKISFTSQRVSQVFVSFKPITAPIFPAVISCISTLWLECICTSLQILSFSQVEAL